jgi:DNA replication protein DnaC
MEKINRTMESLLNMQTSENRCACGSDIENFKDKKCKDCLEKDRIEHLRKTVQSVLSSSGVPKRHLGCSFDNFSTYSDQNLTNALEQCRSIDSKFTDSLFLSSPRPGTGKTHLSVAIMRSLVLNGLSDVLFISSPFLFLEIKNSFNSQDEHNTEKKIIEKYSSHPFLVVDDIGVEKVSEWANQIWYMIIDSRYSKMLPTVYTSNLTVGQIAEKIDPRIASRLSSGIVINLDCKDYRRNK